MYEPLKHHKAKLEEIAARFNDGLQERFLARNPSFREGQPCHKELANYTKPVTVKLGDIGKSSQGGCGCRIFVGNGYYTLLQFTLDRFPACCAATMMHHFSHEAYLLPPDDTVLCAFMDAVFHYASQAASREYGDMYLNNKRIQIMMVECTDRWRKLIMADEHTSKLRLVDIPNIENPTMQYPKFYTYFKSKARCNERLFYNVNSDNIIHDMEVILA